LYLSTNCMILASQPHFSISSLVSSTLDLLTASLRAYWSLLFTLLT
jgi:hypothetical protein